MATSKQTKALNNLVENKGNLGKAMREAGYSKSVSNNPKNLTNSKGYRALADELGLTDTFITDCLLEDIKAKPQNRKGELELASKIKGLQTDRHEIEITEVKPILMGITQPLITPKSIEDTTDA